MLLGRQINARTVPTPENGFFDSRVLSRQHAQIWADKQTGQVWIRDIKSSNGTFLNGRRLSNENEGSEPFELKTNDLIDLGINISSDDSKTVLHNRVSAKVEKAGFASAPPFISTQPGGQGNSFALLNQFGVNSIQLSGPAAGSISDSELNFGGFNRNGANVGLLPNGGTMAASLKATGGPGKSKQRIISRMMPSFAATFLKGPISLEMVIKKISNEVQFAKAQHSDLQRVTQLFESMAKTQAESVQEAAKNADDAAVESVNEKLKTSRNAESRSVSIGESSWQHSPNSKSAGPEKKLVSLSVTLKSVEQELQESSRRVTELEQLLERETYARELAESQLEHAHRELELEREQAISDLCAESDDNADGPIVLEDEAAADTMALIDKEEKRRSRSGSGTSSSNGNDGRALNIGQVIAQLEHTRREVQVWEVRALKAEHIAEENARALESFVQQLQSERGIIMQPGPVNRSSSRGRNGTPSSPITRVSTLTPDQFKRARSSDEKLPPLAYSVSNEKKPSTRTVQSLKTELRSKADGRTILMPLMSSIGVVAVGMGVMVMLNEWTRSGV